MKVPEAAADTDAKPLEGVRVVDFTRVLSGPYCTMLLADMGAEVIKIERLGTGDETRAIPPLAAGESHYFLALNRSKKSVALDLGTAAGAEIARDLVRSADVVVENFRPGVTERLGLDYKTLSAEHEKLIYCSISAFGQTGPYANRPGFDLVAQALSGAMHLTGEPNQAPVRLGLSMGDLAAGLFGALGTSAALADRNATGSGRHVDVSMFDGMLSLLTYHATRWLLAGEDPGPVGSGHPSFVPYGSYPTSDGYVTVAPFSESFWPKLCEALGHPEWSDDERYKTNKHRLQRRAEVDGMVASVMCQRTAAEWCETLERADVPHAPILSPAQAIQHPQAIARRMLADLPHPLVGPMSVIGPGVRFQGAKEWMEDATSPPLLGEHTRDVLTNLLGFSAEKVDRLLADGVAAGTSA